MKKSIIIILPLLIIVSLWGCYDTAVAHFSFKPEKITHSPRTYEKNVSDVFIETSDNVKIHSLYFADTNSKKAVLYFHGNAGNIYNRYDNASDLNKRGVNVLLVEYRGYGRSEGEPTEPGLYRDAEAAYNHLLKKGFKPADIYILGRSIGSTVTMEIAQNKLLGGIILISPLSTGQEMARLMGFGWFSWIASPIYNNVAKAKNIKSPVLLIHGDNDTITPLRFGKNLYEALPEKDTKFIVVKGADHNGMIEFVGPEFWTWVYDFINLNPAR